MMTKKELKTKVNEIMTRVDLKKRFEKLCDNSDGCDGCPCEYMRVCNEGLYEELTDADYEEGIKALENAVTVTEEITADFDVVERPKHYASTSIECIDAMRETQGVEATKDFCICNAFKYLWRHNNKNGDEDIKKANWYLNKAVELMGKES